jgi:hypothetical protein
MSTLKGIVEYPGLEGKAPWALETSGEEKKAYSKEANLFQARFIKKIYFYPRCCTVKQRSYSNSNFGHTDFKVWRSLHACHSEGATYRNHCSLMVEKKMFYP